MNTQGKPLQPSSAAFYTFQQLLESKKWYELKEWYAANAPWLTVKTIELIIVDLQEETSRIDIQRKVDEIVEDEIQKVQ